MKVKVLFIESIRVHGMHSYLYFLGTMFGKLFQNERFFYIFKTFLYNKHRYLIYLTA